MRTPILLCTLLAAVGCHSLLPAGAMVQRTEPVPQWPMTFGYDPRPVTIHGTEDEGYVVRVNRDSAAAVPVPARDRER